jgi:anti-sigma28 factor (negative regulator of flagellin synthesis)
MGGATMAQKRTPTERRPAKAREAREPVAPDEDLYSAEYLAEVAGGDAREERLAELKRRIELGAYKPDAASIAEGMLSRAGVITDGEEDL